MFTRSSGTFRAGNAEAETVETVWTRSNVLEASVSHNKKEWSDYWTLMKVKPLLFYFEHNFQGENCRKTTLLNKEFLVFWSNVFLTWATMQKNWFDLEFLRSFQSPKKTTSRFGYSVVVHGCLYICGLAVDWWTVRRAANHWLLFLGLAPTTLKWINS